MRLIIVSIVTILTCSTQLVFGTTLGNTYRYKAAHSRRQARQMRTLEPRPSACDRSPCQNGATCEWMDVPITCDCAVGFMGPVCEINIDECASSPCTNNGHLFRCVDYINGYECACRVGYGGSECLTELNECDSNPCQHDGYCSDRFNGFICSCASGFSGTVCEENLDDCMSYPCLNQARCIDGVNSFSCLCKHGFNGLRCENAVNECALMPCRNGGRCMDMMNGFQCVCAEGFHGRTCTQEINKCAQYPCRNGGRCTDLGNGFVCTCQSGFIGRRCERGLQMCSDANCFNGGTCESDREFTYCICEGGYSGRICQFHEKDYTVKLVGGKSDREGRVEVYYRNKWGPIADSKWTIEDASTVCHHLGYHSAAEAFPYSEFGNSYDPAQICEMVCTGNEHVVQECVLDQPAVNVGCRHKSHVGVICSELASPCPVSWRLWGSSCYYVDPKPRTWDNAKKICQKKGANLVNIESELENEFLRDYLEKNHGGYPAAWIGLSDVATEGAWDWLGQQNNSFKNWNLGEPNNGGIIAMIRTSKSVMMSTYDETIRGQNCVEILTINGKWNDIECSMKRPTFCETVQETMTSVRKMSPGLIAVIAVIVIVFIVGGVITAGLIIT